MRVVSVFDGDIDAVFALGKGEVMVGFLIGMESKGRDYALHFIPTPKQKDSLPTAGWLVQHFKQVIRALPGGLKVLGAFHHGPPASQTEFEKRVLSCVAKIYQNQIHYRPFDDCNEESFLILNLCTSTKRVTCRELPPSAKSRETPSFADVKKQFQRLSVRKFHSRIAVNIHTASDETVSKRLQDEVEQLTRQLKECPYLIDGVSVPGSTLIENLESQSSHEVSLFRALEHFAPPLDEDNENTPSWPAIQELKGTQIRVSGNLDLGLRNDAVRSLITRIELLEKDLADSSEEGQQNQDPFLSKSVFLLPCRMYFVLSQVYDLFGCEYMFEDEPDQEGCIDRCCAMLGVSRPVELLCPESFPKQTSSPINRSSAPSVPSTTPSPSAGAPAKAQSHQSLPIIPIVAAVALALLFMLFSFNS
eukprot:c9920_g1_i1.p1 GENE.c9920_g1_i1~~c9920_g1_i1.p1  ORF type:complete len:419 (-),score=84.89 c9920_g1_i1:5-1261(-)